MSEQNTVTKSISDAGANTADPMDERTLTALQGSIAKWQAIVDGVGDDDGAMNCPLCQLFLSACCDGCPVAERSQQPECRGTPYMKWMNAQGHNDHYPFSVTARTLPLAQAELAFLQSLLP